MAGERIIIREQKIIFSFILISMHKEILTKEQEELLPIIKQFSSDYYLVGGTAIAFHLGHRRSIDFDLFTQKSFDNTKIIRKIRRSTIINRIITDEPDQLTIILNSVKMTFFCYPFSIVHRNKFENIIALPNLLTLAAMKAFALGRRPKWKDYVDLYFILKHYSVNQIVKESQKIFNSEFNERLFRSQLTYFDDINYAEQIEFMLGFEVKEKEVKKELIKISLS